MVKLEKIFKPDFEYDLLRIGSNHDGGYLIEKNSLIYSDFLMSFGVSTNWDFEKDFIKKNKVPLIAFDGSVNKEFWNLKKKDALIRLKKLSISKLIEFYIIKYKFDKFFNNHNFVSKFISSKLPNSLTFNEALNLCNGNNIFFKIDIEGSEYEILNDIIENQKKINGLAIELHDFNQNKEIVIKFIKKFNLKLVHTHVNNYDLINSDCIKTIELSFSRKPLILGEFKKLPHVLDSPNNKKKDELIINFD